LVTIVIERGCDMLGSNRELKLLFSALAVAGCLLAVGIVVAVDRLMYAGQPVAARIIAAQR
jgi:hypothetical protein